MKRAGGADIGGERVWLALGLSLVVALVAAQGLATIACVAVGARPQPKLVMALVLGAGVLAMIARAATGRAPIVEAIARRLPDALDGSWRRRRGRAIAFAILATLALVQTARAGVFMVDPTASWGAIVPVPKVARHMCFTAYLRAAELARRGDDNVYRADHYPAFTDPDADPPPPTPSDTDGMAPYVFDPFEYPPPFLVLPRLAIAISSSFVALRAAWWSIQVLGFVALALVLARRMGGRRGLGAGLLLAALLASPTVLANFQTGQFQLAAIALGVAAMLAFERQRDLLGGALLGGAIVAKLFPGVLLVLLVAQRRWRAVPATIAWALAFTLLGLAVVGVAPYRAFLGYQLPRISSGEAFSFSSRSAFHIAGNLAVFGIVGKLRLLGAPLGDGVARVLAWVYTLVPLALAWRAGRDRPALDVAAPRWLALLSLASLRSPLSPSFYVLGGTAWLLALVGGRLRRRWLVPAWVVATVALPPLPSQKLLAVLGLAWQAAVIAIAIWTLLRLRSDGEARA